MESTEIPVQTTKMLVQATKNLVQTLVRVLKIPVWTNETPVWEQRKQIAADPSKLKTCAPKFYTDALNYETRRKVGCISPRTIESKVVKYKRRVSFLGWTQFLQWLVAQPVKQLQKIDPFFPQIIH